jgi:hypothetical protein
MSFLMCSALAISARPKNLHRRVADGCNSTVNIRANSKNKWLDTRRFRAGRSIWRPEMWGYRATRHFASIVVPRGIAGGAMVSPKPRPGRHPLVSRLAYWKANFVQQKRPTFRHTITNFCAEQKNLTGNKSLKLCRKIDIILDTGKSTRGS